MSDQNEEPTRRTSYDNLRDEIAKLNHNLELLIVNQEHSHANLEKTVADLTKIVEQNHRVLFRSNGTKGLIERVEDIEEQHTAEKTDREAQKTDFRKIKVSVLSAAALLAFDLIIHILPQLGILLQELNR